MDGSVTPLSLAVRRNKEWEDFMTTAPEIMQPILRRKHAARLREAERIGLIPDIAYTVVTELTLDQKEQLHNVMCPIKGHRHRLRVVYTIVVEDGQLFSRLACDQGATYRWEVTHGVSVSRINKPHWGFSKKDDTPYGPRYETDDYL